MVVALRCTNPDHCADPVRYESFAEASRSDTGECGYLVAHCDRDARVIRLSEHITRMKRSAAQLGYECPWSDAEIRRCLARLLGETGYMPARFRVVAERDGSLRLTLGPHTPPSEHQLTKGVVCALVPGSNRHDAQVKSSSWSRERERLRAPQGDMAAPEGAAEVYEYLLADDEGRILEGSSSNFFAVFGAGDKVVLHTAADGVLGGITRARVLECAQENMPVSYEPVKLAELAEVSEAFITSSTRGVVPVRSIGTRFFGDRGVWTERIQQAYSQWVEQNAEALYSPDLHADT